MTTSASYPNHNLNQVPSRILRGEIPPPPIAQLIGFTLTALEPGQATLQFQAAERHANPMGSLHGGVLCDVADAAMGMAYATTLADGESFTTLELKINFLKPVWDAKLTAVGHWRYIQRDAQGNEFAFNGVYKEVVPPERLTYTFEFEPMAGHISTETVLFDQLPDGKTRLTTLTTFTSLEDLEGMLQSGMEGGAVETWDRLEELLAESLKEKG